MRTIPGMTIINPCDDTEAKAAVEAAIQYVGPVYLRFGRLACPVLNDPVSYRFEMGKGVMMRDGSDVTLVATGLMVWEAIQAADALAEEGISARVINIHTIKPIDRDILIKAAKETGAVVTAEEHSVIGGLGGAVSEVLTEEYPVPVLKVGVEDRFGMSGPAKEVLTEYGLDAAHIVAKAKDAIAKKK